ncbi:putative calcium-binding protein CML10 [Dendrobium catenatum]|uniref:Putative calcium-binding protein CML10 n=1 Tax=Dendrobium catenatum TaxID=906689 RepID=A0A2I0VYY8_9ASPA|nr:putative calcium-binding protein CML10 [Dendrobium catenatum]
MLILSVSLSVPRPKILSSRSSSGSFQWNSRRSRSFCPLPLCLYHLRTLGGGSPTRPMASSLARPVKSKSPSPGLNSTATHPISFSRPLSLHLPSDRTKPMGFPLLPSPSIHEEPDVNLPRAAAPCSAKVGGPSLPLFLLLGSLLRCQNTEQNFPVIPDFVLGRFARNFRPIFSKNGGYNRSAKNKKLLKSRSRIFAALFVFDLDRNRLLSAEELARVMHGLGEGVFVAQCWKMTDGVDQDGNDFVASRRFFGSFHDVLYARASSDPAATPVFSGIGASVEGFVRGCAGVLKDPWLLAASEAWNIRQ